MLSAAMARLSRKREVDHRDRRVEADALFLGDTLRRSGKHAAALVFVALDLASSAYGPEIRAVI